MARAAKAAEKEAEVIISSLSKASTAAVDTTLESIVAKLRGNVPLMYHIHALLSNETWTGVLVASITGAHDSGCGEKPEDKSRKLRATAKKFVHLPRRRSYSK